MPTPAEFMKQYRALKVNAVFDDPVAKVCRTVSVTVQLKNYFMMNWSAGTEQLKDFNAVTSAAGSKKNEWFRAHQQQIQTAAMGKGAPVDYQFALEWAVLSGKISNPTQNSVQSFCDEHLGIDCSGLVTNYLIANGKMANSASVRRNTGSASFYNPAKAVNDPTAVRQGDLLVWMKDNKTLLTGPGHVAVVDSYVPQSSQGGNMRVVEATGAAGANPKLLDSMYSVEQIVAKGGDVPAMVLVVGRHGTSGQRVVVIRP